MDSFRSITFSPLRTQLKLYSRQGGSAAKNFPVPFLARKTRKMAAPASKDRTSMTSPGSQARTSPIITANSSPGSSKNSTR